jgi:mono/diheme cytochrome c family protein
MKKLTVIAPVVIIILFFCAFTAFIEEAKPEKILPSKQRTGNAAKGYDYLVTGDYIKSGVPYSAFAMAQPKDKHNYLKRGGANENISYEYTAVKAPNGETVVVPNCLQCHAQVFDGKLIVGLGNSFIDFTKESKINVKSFSLLEKFLKIGSKAKFEAATPFITVSKTIAPYLYTEVQGVNAADRLAAVLAAHRDPQTLAWNKDALLPIPEGAVPTDTPPWWLLKKKNAMFYNGMGRGDFGRFLMASNLLTVYDTAEANGVDSHMPDLLAYIYSLTPPKYPAAINTVQAEAGKAVFEKSCSGCHGTYGTNATYPNLLIPQHIIQTDSLLSTSNYSSPQFTDWFNKSWFTSGDHPARLQPYKGYIAPPLDGIWVTAPYLHNGSVPNLEALLNSKERPPYWKRAFDKPEYDYNKTGWKYVTTDAAAKGTYNTTLPGYSNSGHPFGDKLTPQQRTDVIEYLKTL